MVGRSFVFLQFVWSEEYLIKITSSEATPETWWWRGRKLKHPLFTDGLCTACLPSQDDLFLAFKILQTKQWVLGESAGKSIRLFHTPWVHCSKSRPKCSLKIRCRKRADDAGWDTACLGTGHSPLDPMLSCSLVGNGELTARCPGLGESD